MSNHPLDLSTLPPDLRRVVEQQLAKLPPQAREKLLREGSPIVERMLARAKKAAPPPLPGGQRAQAAAAQAARGVSTAAERASDVAERLTRVLPKGHYNATIRPGDSRGGGRWFMLLLAAAVFAAIYWR